MFKKGNQLYLEISIGGSDGSPLEIQGVDKVLFTFKTNDCMEAKQVLKTYDGVSNDVIYENGKFEVWIKQEDSFLFSRSTSVDARILYKNNVIIGTDIKEIPTLEALSEEIL